MESQFKILTDGMRNNTKEIKLIKDNHLTHLDKKVTKLATNQVWIMESVKKWDKRLWAIIIGISGTLVATILTLIFK